MRWFKHLSMAHDDQAIATLIEEMGPDGYGIYWLLLEHFAAAMPKDCKSVPEITRSIQSWAGICGCKTSRKFAKFSNTAAKLKLIESKTEAELRQYSSRMPAKRLQICIPNLLKYRDEYSKKSGQDPDKLRRDSKKNPAVDRDRDRERELEQQSSLCMESVQSQKHSGAREAESPHTPPTPVNGNGNGPDQIRNGHRAAPVLASLPHWEKTCVAARQAGMSYDPSPQSEAARQFRLLTLPERIAAIEGISKRIECGEYNPTQPAFTHKLENYLAKRIWEQPLRPQTRGLRPKRSVGSAMERLAKGATGD